MHCEIANIFFFLLINCKHLCSHRCAKSRIILPVLQTENLLDCHFISNFFPYDPLEFFADKIYVIGMHGQLLIAPLVKPKWVGYLLLQVKPWSHAPFGEFEAPKLLTTWAEVKLFMWSCHYIRSTSNSNSWSCNKKPCKECNILQILLFTSSVDCWVDLFCPMLRWIGGWLSRPFPMLVRWKILSLKVVNAISNSNAQVVRAGLTYEWAPYLNVKTNRYVCKYSGMINVHLKIFFVQFRNVVYFLDD